MKTLDLQGSTFGRLTVVERAPNRTGRVHWRCQCECGRFADVARGALTAGLTRSCGCWSIEQKQQLGRSTVEDLTDQRFGRLTVVRRDMVTRKGTEAVWVCQCDCGQVLSVRGGCLRRGTTRSCGCYAREEASRRAKTRALPRGQAALNDLFGRYQRQALQRNLPFSLTKQEFSSLVVMDCHYCGDHPQQVVQSRYGRNGGMNYNGIDRQDNTRGYESDNVVPCCGTCNFAKKDRSLLEFILWVERVAERVKSTCPQVTGSIPSPAP